MEQPTASFAELAQELVFREHQIALLQVEASMLAAELFQNGFLEREGYNSPTDCLRFNCHLPDKVASDRINVGEHLVELASGGKQANIQVTASVETLKGLAGAAAGEMEFSLPISSLA